MTATSREHRAPPTPRRPAGTTPRCRGSTVHPTTSGSAAEPSTSDGSGTSTPGGHITSTSNVATMIPASEGISPTTSVRPLAMGLITGAPAMRRGRPSMMGSYGGTSATRFGGPSAIDVASGGGHLTTTFGGRPAVGFIVVGGGYPTTAAGGLLSAMRFTGGAPAADVINGHPTPTTSGFAPATSYGDDRTWRRIPAPARRRPVSLAA